jgi:hypothetical protein
LGDDDAVRENAVALLLETISDTSEDIGCFNFSTDFNLYQSDAVIATTSELEHYLNNNKQKFNYPVSNFVYISVTCYKLEVFKKLVRYGYLYASTHCPHFGMILIMLLKRQGSLCIKKSQLVKWDPNHSGRDWSKIRLITGTSFFSELESLDDSCVTIVKSLVNEFCPRGFVKWIFKIVIGDTDVPIGYWYCFFGRLIYFGRWNVKISSICFLFLLPALAIPAVRKLFFAILNPRYRSKLNQGENRI